MSAHTKMHLTKNHPKRKSEKRSIPWRDVFKKEIAKYGEAGLALRGLRARENLSQKKLAEIIGVLPHHISEMENKKRSIGKEMAKRLAKALHADYRVFL
jgi:DNA-binding XRE family transcriptional regulator